MAKSITAPENNRGDDNLTVKYRVESVVWEDVTSFDNERLPKCEEIKPTTVLQTGVAIDENERYLILSHSLELTEWNRNSFFIIPKGIILERRRVGEVDLILAPGSSNLQLTPARD